MRQAYVRIFDRMGLTYRMVQADSGAIGGSTSAEFQVLVDSGEDAIVACDKLRLRRERRGGDGAGGRRARRRDARRRTARRCTRPGTARIEDVAKFLGVDAEADAQVAPLRRPATRS